MIIEELDQVYFRSPSGFRFFGFVAAVLDTERFIVRCEFGPYAEVYRSEILR
jgi:hypothetical protein